MKVWIETLGCKVNSYESEVIRNLFIKNNYTVAKEASVADVIVVNTCSVTNQADSKSRKVIRSLKRENPNSIIVVCGCFAENHQNEILDIDIDILLGNQDKTKIVDFVNDYLVNNNKIIDFKESKNLVFERMSIDNYYDKTRAFVKIQDGCNNYCSYCIIPYIRGNIRNKDLNDAIEEIKSLIDNGYKEIVLTGIHTGSYNNLVKLIQEISKFNSLERIRISSIEATEINDDFLEELKNNSKICDHLHIPIQSGSNDVLRMMNRKYNIDEYLRIINKIRNIRPLINITTDLIVGFPTETKDDFNETIDTLKKIEFGKIHVFPYSKRDGTAAAKMNNLVTDQEKKLRVREVINLSNSLENKYYNKFINQSLMVLVEEIFPTYSVGHTSNYLRVIINQKLEHNKLYLVKITKVDGLNVYGEIV